MLPSKKITEQLTSGKITQGSRIKDLMVVENALDLKEKVPSAPTLGHRGSRVEYQRKYCRKMQTKREEQKKQHSHR